MSHGHAPEGAAPPSRRVVERVQTGVRMERRILGVLRALADMHGLSLGDLLEGMVLHAFEGKTPFGPASLDKIRMLREAFGLTLVAADSHQLVEGSTEGSSARTRKAGSPPIATASRRGRRTE
jgi:hypothetical protein